MSKPRIIIADSDTSVRATVRRHVEDAGFLIDEAADGIALLKQIRRHVYGVIIIDRDIPEIESRQVCQQIRKNANTPIIVLSGNSTEEEKLSFFELGVDDFLNKPFSCRELIARIKVILRHMASPGGSAPRQIMYGELYIDFVSHEVFVQERTVNLSPKEYRLLEFLAGNPNKAMTRETILSNVWGDDFFGSDRTVDTHIKSLRNQIKPFDRYINTVWGYGYMFKT
jgi:DNA-binding response OmpR family regulator